MLENGTVSYWTMHGDLSFVVEEDAYLYIKLDQVVNSSGSDMVNFNCTEYRGPTQQKLE